MIKTFESYSRVSLEEVIPRIYTQWKSIHDIYGDIGKYQFSPTGSSSDYGKFINISNIEMKYEAGWGSNFLVLNQLFDKPLDEVVNKYLELEKKEDQYRSEIDWKKPSSKLKRDFDKITTIDRSMKIRSFFETMDKAFNEFDMYHIDFINSILDDTLDESEFIIKYIPYYFEIPQRTWTGQKEWQTYNLKILLKWITSGDDDLRRRSMNRGLDRIESECDRIGIKTWLQSSNEAITGPYWGTSILFKLI